MTIRATWPDGHVTEAGSWTWLMRRVHELNWNRDLTTAEAMRNELSRRAHVLSGEVIRPSLPAADFWYGLEHAGMLRLEVTR